MKTKTLKIFALAILTAAFFTSCEKNDVNQPDENSILPEKFSIDIPNSISQSAASKKSTDEIRPLNGNAIYEHLTTFIKVGEGGAEIVEDIIRRIVRFRIDKPMFITFPGDEDNRIKNIEVVENVFYEGITWEYQLTMSDAESEMEEDGGIGLQIFWNRYPRKGIAILKPYQINRDNNDRMDQAVFRIDYSEAGESGYDAHMIVAVSDLPLENPLDDPFSVSALKMFVGKKGDIVNVYGNTDHPNATFFTPNTGFNWSFVASGKHRSNIGVAEVGLPPSNLDETSRSVLLVDYSIKNVFTSEIYELWPNIDEETVAAYLHNTEAPGFFNNGGFVQGGVSPGNEYDELLGQIALLSPYNPKDISNLELKFKQ